MPIPRHLKTSKVFLISLCMLALLLSCCPTIAIAGAPQNETAEKTPEEGESLGGQSPGESSEGEGDSDAPEPWSTASYFYTQAGDAFTVYSSEELFLNETIDPFKAQRICLLLVPAGQEITDFVNETEWPFYAAIEGFDVACLQTDWDEKNNAQTYFEGAYETLAQAYGDTTLELFLIGYEDSADFAFSEAMAHTDRYTGLVALGGEGVSEENIDSQKEAGEEIPLSVWVFASKKTSQLNSNLAYWKEANGITATALRSYQQKFADELYLPATSTAGKITDEEQQRMGIVAFSRISNFYDATLSGNITRNFISKVNKNSISFRESITGGEIYGFNDFRFSYNRMQLNGQQRDYWVFTPASAVIGTEDPSLIICLHGNGGNGEDMIFRSMWHETADNNNCIVVYPSSLYKTGSQHYWQNIQEELTFIRELVETVCSEYHVDRSRIYVTGFSNGAGMAQNLAVRCSDLFAAAALGAPVYFDEEYFGPVEEIHEMAIIFSYGSADPYLKQFNMTADINDIPAIRHLEYWRRMYGFDQAFYKMDKQGIFTMYTYNNRHNIPVVQWFVVEGKEHSYPKEETGLFYDFMKCYSRGEDGTLYYYDQVVLSK